MLRSRPGLRFGLALALVGLALACVGPRSRPAPTPESAALREALREESLRRSTVERATAEAHRAGD